MRIKSTKFHHFIPFVFPFPSNNGTIFSHLQERCTLKIETVEIRHFICNTSRKINLHIMDYFPFDF